MIGPSLVVQGDVTGDEDLMIQGKVEGTVKLGKNSVTVGKNGRVKADIYGKTITIEGEVTGNLFGGEKIVVSHSGKVRGNITAPRVTLEDGARFKGSIDMDGKTTAEGEGDTKATGSSSGDKAEQKSIAAMNKRDESHGITGGKLSTNPSSPNSR